MAWVNWSPQRDFAREQTLILMIWSWINKECAFADMLSLVCVFSFLVLCAHRNWKSNLISNSENITNELPVTSNASQLSLSLCV